ncbi:hypothetical protein AB5J52_32060 [Streptomyces sp. R39]|uniref:Uncharacterized protein n=1 Tax=Streptomyces sp. R39 TaxID=3238631 RepID=A0AB39QYV7_9ACTN
MEEHEKTLEKLKSMPVIPARWIEEGTGVTYRQQWERDDWAARGELLRKTGILILMGGTTKEPAVWLHLPDDLAQRKIDLHAGHIPTAPEEWQGGPRKATEPFRGHDAEIRRPSV